MIKISLGAILVGVPVLAALSMLVVPDQDNTALFTDQQTVRINGTLISVRNKDDITLATLETCMQLPIVLFDAVPLDTGRRVSLIGKKQTREGELQVVVDELSYQ